MKKIEIPIKAILAVLFIGCLFDWNYGYYQLVRFLAMVGFIILAYNQYQKNKIKAKHKQRRNFYNNKEKEKLAHLQQIIGEQYNAMVDIVYSKLDGIVQSSALVETINSIVRSYLNTTRNHISQNLLNLIMFYHNNRRYNGGKRKGKTPLEILTGNKINQK